MLHIFLLFYHSPCFSSTIPPYPYRKNFHRILIRRTEKTAPRLARDRLPSGTLFGLLFRSCIVLSFFLIVPVKDHLHKIDDPHGDRRAVQHHVRGHKDRNKRIGADLIGYNMLASQLNLKKVRVLNLTPAFVLVLLLSYLVTFIPIAL